jgi:hypothetical protein
MSLEGTVSRDFLLLVFFMNQFPPSPRVFHLDRFVFFRKFAEIFASQGANCRWYQRHRWQICHRYQRHRWQIFPLFSLALLIPVANLPPVSTIPAANLPSVSLTPVANNGNNTLSGCRDLQVNLKVKIYMYVNSTTQRCPNKLIKIFLLEGFYHLPPVSLTPVANLEL